jgi:small subunit ribosomal protein S6
LIPVATDGDRPAGTSYCFRFAGRTTTQQPSCRGTTVAASPKEVETALRAYEVMVILDPSLDERTVAPSLDTYLNVVRQDGGEIENVDVWGKRRLAYEIDKNAEGIYAVIDLKADPATVKELDRQLTLNESVLRTKVIRPDVH